jgi:anti-anti-sigma factor
MSDDPRSPPHPPERKSPGAGSGAADSGIVPGAGTPPLLDQVFDGDSLYALRAAVAAHALQAGLPQGHVGDLVVVVHELAANAVRHGAGHGRLRVWKHDQALHFLVADDGPLQAAGAADGTEEQSRDAALWRADPGHGLWLVRQLADQLSLSSGPHGTTAAGIFTFGTPEPDPPFRLSQHSQSGCTILVITGQLDLGSADQLIDALDEACTTSPPPPLILDLAALTSWHSSAVAALLTAQQRVNAHPSAQMILAGLPRPLFQRLHDVGLAGRFTVADTTDNAIRKITPPA